MPLALFVGYMSAHIHIVQVAAVMRMNGFVCAMRVEGLSGVLYLPRVLIDHF